MIKISASSSKKWLHKILRLSTEITNIDHESILESSKVARDHLPDIQALRKAIKYGKGYIEISGIPIDSVIPSPPNDGKKPHGKGNISELSLVGVSHALGMNPFAYKEEKNGEIVHT